MRIEVMANVWVSQVRMKWHIQEHQINNYKNKDPYMSKTQNKQQTNKLLHLNDQPKVNIDRQS